MRGRRLYQPDNALVARWGAPSIVASVQSGTVTIGSGSATGTATIVAVNTANALVVWAGATSNETSANETDYLAGLTLTNATTVTATRTGTGAFTCSVRFTVIEFWPGLVRSAQYGSVSLSGTLSATATITGVNTTKSAVMTLGYQTNRNAASGLITGQEWDVDLVVTNATTITASHNLASGNWVIRFVVLEFF